MAEKRRGLGRGLGSLIPSQEPGRPSDVFFPRGERSTDAAVDGPEETAKERRSSDPAESMRRAQAGRRSAATKRTTRSTGSATTTAATETTAEKTTTGKAGSKATAGKTTAGKSTASKSTANKSTANKTTGSKTTSSTATGTKSTASKSPASSGAGGKVAATKKPAGSKAASRAPDGEPSNAKDSSTGNAEPVGAAGSSVVAESDGLTRDPTADLSNDHSSDATTEHKDDQDTNNNSNKEVAAPPVNEERSGTEEATEPSVDGVYVSRETVQTHSSSEPAAGVAVRDLQSGDTASTESGGPAPEGAEASQTAVSRETDEDDGFDDLVPVPGTTFGEIDLDLIRPNPRQPRDVFDEDALDELITSIREIGVLQPVVVRRRPELPGHYELIMGERRFRASKEAGKKTIPAIVRATADDDLLRDALLENLHRVDLNPLEEAAAYAQLLEDFNCTQEELSARIGRSRPQISNTIRLLRLPAMVQRRVAAGVLSSGHARALLGLSDGANMEVLAQRVVAEGLSVRATEEAVILLNRGDRVTVSRGTRDTHPELAELARSLGDRLDTRVNVVMGKRKGKLSVEFANGDDLSRILMLLGLDSSSQPE
ncbi:ParB/RepB/Spo0J family partition protein [Brevibacterium yomogidense]|uniref:ParB/RepB/Spo0J family partition protein n=1 Tax=Brevibacterium yomogidense TaxID=946573 RepID=UPI0018DF1086